MQIEYNARFSHEPSAEPQYIYQGVRLNTNIHKFEYPATETQPELTYWEADVQQYDILEWREKQVNDLQETNTQLWDTVEYLLKQVEAGIPKL